MADYYGDMPQLVDPSRGYDVAAPQPLPAGAGLPSPFFPQDPQQHQRGPPPSAYMYGPQSTSYGSSPSSGSGYPWSSPSETLASTSTSPPSAWQYQSMPATPVPMFTGPPVGVVQPFVPVGPGPGSDGWPREREREESAPQSWRHDRLDESYAVVRRPPSRSSTPHHPSLSLNSSPSSGSGGSLSRNASLRGPGAESAKRPPREWRSDFSMTGPGLFGALLTRSRSRSFAGNDIPYPKVVLNAYIRYTSSRPPMHLDLRRSPNTLKFRALDHPLSRWDLTRFACEPPLPHMRLFHAQLPWYIDVDLGANPAGVTLFDVFSAIHMCMMTPIVFGDFYNNEMNNDLRDQIAAAWAERCTSAEERNRGVRRVDFLMGKVVMEGIQKGRDGLWEIKTRKIGL